MDRRTLRGALLLAAFAGAAASSSAAQEPLFAIEGTAAGEWLGWRWGFAPLDDVDGDGVADFALADGKYSGTAGAGCGRVRVVSGATRAVLRTYEGENANDEFGLMVRNVGDLDGDGVDDLGVGSLAYPARTFFGKVYVYSGATGLLLHEFVGENADDKQGYLRGVGDATGDGVDDLLVSAFGYAPVAGGFGSGKVYLYSGADGSLVNTWLGAPGSEFGFRLAALHFDADGDGCNDFAVGSRELWTTPQGAGRVEVFSAWSATPIFAFAGANAGDQHSFVNDAADVDGDGTPDLPVHALQSNGGDGELHVYSGADGSLLRTWLGTPEQTMSDAFAMAGDVDGDGFGDVLLSHSGFDGEAGTDCGVVRLLSGATGRELFRFDGVQPGQQLGGNNTYGDFDLDGDGRPDQAFAAFQFDGAAGVDCGRIEAWRGDDLYLMASPATAFANDTVTITATAGKPGNLVMVVATELDGVALFEPITPIVVFDANGELVVSEVVDPAWGVHDVKLQAWAIGRVGRKVIQSGVAEIALR